MVNGYSLQFTVYCLRFNEHELLELTRIYIWYFYVDDELLLFGSILKA